MKRDGVGRLANAGRSLALCLVLIFAWACGADEPATETASETQAPPGSGPVVPVPPASTSRDIAVLEIEGHGTIRVELLPELSPVAVANFVKLAEQELYDGTVFHRVVPGFMVQGGDPNSKDDNRNNDGRGGPGYSIQDEFSEVSFVRGIVAMARTQQANSAGSQFFIVHQDSRHLDGGYAVFGQVIEGMDVVDAMTEVEIDTYGRYGPRSRPRENLVLADVRIEPGAGGSESAPEPPEPAVAEPPDEAGEWDEG